MALDQKQLAVGVDGTKVQILSEYDSTALELKMGGK